MGKVEGTGTGFSCLLEPLNDELDLCQCSFTEYRREHTEHLA